MLLRRQVHLADVALVGHVAGFVPADGGWAWVPDAGDGLQKVWLLVLVTRLVRPLRRLCNVPFFRMTFYVKLRLVYELIITSIA